MDLIQINPNVRLMFNQQWKEIEHLGLIWIKIFQNIRIWQKKKRESSETILSQCCCVILLMLVYCKLYWCVSLMNCTEPVIVNTGFYFVFLAESAILLNRRKNKIMLRWKSVGFCSQWSDFFYFLFQSIATMCVFCHVPILMSVFVIN